MNERTRQLMLEAGYAAPEIASRAQKLTELILKDCAKVILKSSRRPDDMAAILVNHINQHFGVEE
jgi:hypothetical protein